GSETKYPTPEMAAAALMHSIVHDHPFHNGNKRTALVSMLVLLDENGLMLDCPEDELFKFVLLIAQHRVVPSGSTSLADREVLAISDWINSRCRHVGKGERPLQWRRLKRILNEFDCSYELAQGVGSRLNVARAIQVPARRGRTRQKLLHTQVKFSGD